MRQRVSGVAVDNAILASVSALRPKETVPHGIARVRGTARSALAVRGAGHRALEAKVGVAVTLAYVVARFDAPLETTRRVADVATGALPRSARLAPCDTTRHPAFYISSARCKSTFALITVAALANNTQTRYEKEKGFTARRDVDENKQTQDVRM